ncbi:hypothetical protein KR009_002055 [Drosophila setifemur]|nr:hypothetical protein KR009_002055 [Drosophila setifemur]
MLKSYLSFALLQLLLPISVIVIHLRPTWPDGLEPQKVEHVKWPPPSDRLVIFVRDGLAAQSFFANSCRNIPLMQELFLKEGLIGVSRPETITYSPLSPYVALFSGVNEDAASVARQWIRKPPELDSIFNRSNRSYAWLTSELSERYPGLVNTSKILRFKSNPGVTVSRSEFERAISHSVDKFLFHGSHSVQNSTGVVFFLHLTGVEPSRENLPTIEKHIYDLYLRFEKAFPDKRTAYLLTSNLGDPQPKSDCKLPVESPFFLWGCGVAHVTKMPGRSIVVNETGLRLPLHVINPHQITALISALLGLPPPVNNQGILPKGMLKVSVGSEAIAMLTNARQLLAQVRRQRQLHPRWMPAFWLDFQLMDSFLKNCNGLKTQGRFRALREYAGNFMPVLVMEIDYYKHYYTTALMWAVGLAGIGWLFCVRCHLAGRNIKKMSIEVLEGEGMKSQKLMWCRALARSLTGLLVIYMLLDEFPLAVLGILLLPSLYWMLSLKVIGERPKMVCPRSLISSSALALICLGGFVRRYIMGFGYLTFAVYSNRKAFRHRGLQFYVWLLLLVGLTYVSVLPESLGCSQPNALIFSILLTLLRPLACGIHHSLVTWLSNVLVLLVALEFVLVGWYPWTTYMVSWIYLGYISFFHRRNLQPSEVMFFNLSTLYTLTCTSYESVVVQMLALELQMNLRMKLEREEDIGPKTAANYIVVYSWYSLFVIGSFPAFDGFLDILHETCLGYFPLTYGLVMVMKLLLPWLLLICILEGNYKNLWTHERRIFVWLLFMSNLTSLVLLPRVRGYGPWREILSRFAEFAVVQVFPFIWLGLRRLAHLKLGSKWMSQLP